MIVGRRLDEYVYTGSEVEKTCVRFAKKSIDTNKVWWEKRGQSKTERMFNQIIRGKRSEFAVYLYLAGRGIPCSVPDVAVYAKAGKGYDADLITAQHELHVKSQRKKIHVKSQTQKMASKYGASWIFQNTDRLVAEPKDNDVIALTHTFLDDDYRVQIVGFVYATDVVKNYTLPDVYQLRHSKVVLRLEDIELTEQ